MIFSDFFEILVICLLWRRDMLCARKLMCPPPVQWVKAHAQQGFGVERRYRLHNNFRVIFQVFFWYLFLINRTLQFSFVIAIEKDFVFGTLPFPNKRFFFN